METPIFPHQQFLEINSDIFFTHPLPELFKKRIQGFDTLAEHLKETTGKEHEKLLARLEKLSNELDEDLEEHYEEHLEGYDESDSEPSDQDDHEDEREEPVFYLSDYEAVDPTIDINNFQYDEEDQNQIPYEGPDSHRLSDEEILAFFYKGGIHSLSESDLIIMGFQGDLDERMTIVGKYLLKRIKYTYTYKITLRT